MRDYLKPSECRYTRDDILFILNNCLEGWPSRESGYTDAPIPRSVNPHMPNQSEIEVLAEIKVRLALCGDAGRKLYALFLGVQGQYVIDYGGLTPEGRSVLSYISGICRRVNDCGRCPHKSCKRRGRKPCTFAQWINHHR